MSRVVAVRACVLRVGLLSLREQGRLVWVMRDGDASWDLMFTTFVIHLILIFRLLLHDSRKLGMYCIGRSEICTDSKCDFVIAHKFTVSLLYNLAFSFGLINGS